MVLQENLGTIVPTIQPSPTTRITRSLDINNNVNNTLDPREFRSNSTFGNYVVAGRQIQSDEIIGIDSALSFSAYGPSHSIPYCLSCFKDIALSQRCTKCRWPICDSTCEMSPQHLENECPILSEAKARPRGRSEEYIAIEALRCLLLRDKDAGKWNEMMQLEPHFEEREKCSDAKEIQTFVIRFIQMKCKLKEIFNDAEINTVLGIISVNTFSGFNFVGKHMSLLFPPSVSFIPHDCNPNIIKWIRCTSPAMTDDTGFEDEPEVNVKIITGYSDMDDFKTTDRSAQDTFSMQLTSARSIEYGDVLSINYVDTELSVMERGSYLKDSFYFYCDCCKCRVELFDEIHSGHNVVI